jgi:hypothetical protein
MAESPRPVCGMGPLSFRDLEYKDRIDREVTCDDCEGANLIRNMGFETRPSNTIEVADEPLDPAAAFADEVVDASLF